MTDMDLTRRKILAGAGTIGAAGATAGFGTSAYFSDEETFTGNSLTAGELDLYVHYEFTEDQGSASGNLSTPTSGTIQGGTDSSEGEAVSYEISDVKPGDSGGLSFNFSLVDNPGYLWMNGSLTGNDEGAVTEPESATPWERDGTPDGELATYTRAELYYTSGGNNVTITEGTLYGILADLEHGIPLHGNADPTAGVIDRPTFDGGSSSNEPDGTDDTGVYLKWWVPTWIGNEIQDDSIAFDLSFYAEQARHNDGTGDATVVGTGDDLQTAIVDASQGDTLLLEAGTHTGEVTVDKSVEIRGEGPSNTTYDAHDVGGSGGLTSGRDLGMKIRADGVRVGDIKATGADQVLQFNDNSGSRLTGGMVSNASIVDNGNDGRGRALVLNYSEGMIVRDTDIMNNGNDGLTAWYTNDSHFETIHAKGNGDNGVYFNGDGNVLLDSTVEENAEEGVDVSWKGDLGPSTQRVTLDNIVAKNNGQSGSLPAGEGEDIELHDDDGDDDVADDSALLRKVTTENSSAPIGLRLVNVDESEIRAVQCSFPNGVKDAGNNDVDP